MKAVRRLVIFSVALLLMLQFACAITPARPQREIEYFSLWANVNLEGSADKVLYQAQKQILLAFSAKNQEIYIYKDGLRQNVLGGLGSNFMYLSDIALAQDGTLLALDTAARQVTKYNLDGQAIGTLELKGCVQPVLMTMHADQSMFVYDAATTEVIAYATMDGTEQYRFGRFQLSQVSALSCNRDYLVAYSKDNGNSQIFSVLGQLLKTEPGMVVYDSYNNAICYTAQMLKSLDGKAFLPIPESSASLFIDYDILVLGKGNVAGLYKINYLQER